MSQVEHKVIPSSDPRLDWNPTHDPKSQNYPIRALMGTVVPDEPRMWAPGAVLDQGREGACVGFGWTGELLASPKPDPYTTSEEGSGYALGVYREAQRIDEWAGEDYSGTSVLAGAKVIHQRSLITNYRWAFSVEDVRDAIITNGPVVIGIPWYEEMYWTADSGLVTVGGDLVGGHCILLTGYHPSMRIPGEPYSARYKVFRWRNSWGPSYGRNGNGYVRYEDLRVLLSGWGEACVPVGRQMVRL